MKRAAGTAVVYCLANNVEGIDYSKLKVNKASSFAPTETAFATNQRCGKITNWWFVKSHWENTKKENYKLAMELFSIMGIDPKNGENLSVQMSTTVPGEKAELTIENGKESEAVFQILFKGTGAVAVEYYRNGYFVRIEGTTVQTKKISGNKVTEFTVMSQS